MSLSNLNVNILTCIPKGDNTTGNISFVNIHKSLEIQNVEQRKIKELFFAILFEGFEMESADVDENTFSFTKEYDVEIRIQEIKSGAFITLDKIQGEKSITKNMKKIGSMNTMRVTHICFFENFELPPKIEEEQFVLKVLIKEKNKENNWILQNIYSLNIENETE